MNKKAGVNEAFLEKWKISYEENKILTKIK